MNNPLRDPAVGLCACCRFGHRIVSARGSVFFLCRRAAADPAYVRYPRLPVIRCLGREELACTRDSTAAACAAINPSGHR